MVMDQSRTLAHELEEQVTRCGYCPKQVVFAPTVFGGHALCFDARPMPVRQDRERTGWITGTFVVNGTFTTVYAPWERHPYAHRRYARTVLQLHICSGQSRQAAA